MYSFTRSKRFDASDNIYCDSDWISRIRDLMNDDYKGARHNFKSAVREFGAGAILNALDSDDSQALKDLADNLGFYFAFVSFSDSYQGKFDNKKEVGMFLLPDEDLKGLSDIIVTNIDYEGIADDMLQGDYWLSDNNHLFLLI